MFQANLIIKFASLYIESECWSRNTNLIYQLHPEHWAYYQSIAMFVLHKSSVEIGLNKLYEYGLKKVSVLAEQNDLSVWVRLK